MAKTVAQRSSGAHKNGKSNSKRATAKLSWTHFRWFRRCGTERIMNYKCPSS